MALSRLNCAKFLVNYCLDHDIIVIKYLFLILLFVVLLYFTKFYADYCSNLYVVLFLLPFIGVIALIYIGALYINDYKRKKFRTTNHVVLSLSTLLLINLLIGYIAAQKEIFQKYIPETENGHYTPTLYKNGSFKVRNQMNHGSCTATGHYKMIRDTLHLHFNNEDIEKLTDKTFTFSYKLDHPTGTYEPLNRDLKN
jgi:hypothetical protein